MGNYLCMNGKGQQVQDEWQGPPVKVIRPDGTIEVFKRPVMVEELMETYPGHNVCHSSAMIAALTMKSAMSGDRELEGGRLYYVLPSHKFQDEDAEKKSRSEGGGSRGSNKENFTVEIKHSKSSPGFAQVTVRGPEASLLGYSTPDLRSMHLTRAQPNLTRCDSWKPRLDTINEVGAASRRRIQNFVRSRSLRRSQVHNC
jgi:hypothetical protein